LKKTRKKQIKKQKPQTVKRRRRRRNTAKLREGDSFLGIVKVYFPALKAFLLLLFFEILLNF